MKHICAWCGCELKPPDEKQSPVSPLTKGELRGEFDTEEKTHGICEFCSNMVMAEAKGLIELSEEEKNDIKEVRKLRDYYRRKTADGNSPIFMAWIENTLEKITGIESLG